MRHLTHTSTNKVWAVQFFHILVIFHSYFWVSSIIHCRFNLHKGKSCWISFHVFVDHLHTLGHEMSLHIFLCLLIISFDFLTIEIWEYFYILHANYLLSISFSRIIFQILDCLCTLLTLGFTNVTNMLNSRNDVSDPQSPKLSLIFVTVLEHYALC